MFELVQQNWLFIACGLTMCGAVVVVSAVMMVFVLSRNTKVSDHWQQTAEQTGLSLTGRAGSFSTPSLSGVFRQHPTSVYVQMRGGGGKSYTIVKMTVTNSRGMHLMISPHVSALYRLDIGLSLPDEVKTGDEAFDRYFVVRCTPPEYAASLPGNAALRQNLAALKSNETTFLLELKDAVVEYRTLGMKRSPDRMIAGLNAAADLAEQIDGNS